MLKTNIIMTTSLIVNLFVPGSANIVSLNYKTGTSIIIASILLFFSTPYLNINIIRSLYLLMLITSYLLFFTKKRSENNPSLLRCMLIILFVFFTLSIFSIRFTHKFNNKKNKSANNRNNTVFVLGTKPFKKTSAKKMLKMSDEKLFERFKIDIHPFFRRLKKGLDISNGINDKLLISAGKVQKKITKKILKQMKREADFFSCKSTKEEILTLKDYIIFKRIRNANISDDPYNITIVSDDYHAFRALLYSKYFIGSEKAKMKDIKFSSTSYKYSFFSYLKIYFIEQILFFLSYISSFLNLIGIAV